MLSPTRLLKELDEQLDALTNQICFQHIESVEKFYELRGRLDQAKKIRDKVVELIGDDEDA